MTTEELIKYLENQSNKNVLLELKGIVETEIWMEETKISNIERYLILQSRKIKEQKIILNLHQLMKITKMERDIILLKFDSLQEIKIKLFPLTGE